MNKIDTFLNKITMYRLVLYGLILIAVAAFGLSALDILQYPLISLAGSLGVLLVSSYLSHITLRWAFRSATGAESWLITTLILFLILRPAESLPGFAILVLAAATAMSSKYVLALANRHIFNPAAISLVILGLLGSGEAFWWVGADVLLPVTLLAGLLVVRKVRRFTMVGVFAVTALAMFALSSGIGLQPGELLRNAILSGPLVFFAAIMLIEPSTTPSDNRWRMVYAVLVGMLYGAHFEFDPIYSSPELALVIGNLFAYVVSNKQRIKLSLIQQVPQGAGMYEFVFATDKPLRFRPGQYMEWTLPHHHQDSRGNRRFFTIASAPESENIKMGVRIDPQHCSSFKRALLAMRPGESAWASQLSGDFTLPHDPAQKLVWIAGGVGVTPFRSMARHLQNSGQQRDITFFYSSQTADGFAYWQLFNEASQNGIKSNYMITGPDVPADWSGLTGRLTRETIQEKVPDYTQAHFYLSGPNAMVTSYKQLLKSMDIPGKNIKTDYFPGY